MLYRVESLNEKETHPIIRENHGESWIIVMLTDATEYEKFCGNANGGVYTVKISRKCADWPMAIGDFLEFHQEKNILAVLSERELNIVRKIHKGHSCRDTFLREGEPKVLVHSTSLEAWEEIQRDGRLKCWNRLHREGRLCEETPIGKCLGDPKDFSDYIMFSAGYISGEIVVCSRQSGRIVMDENANYQTGVRLYFDCEKIAKEGRLVRDGIHLKVREELPLEPYLLCALTWKEAGLPQRCATPRIFTSTANRVFRERFPEYQLEVEK